MDLIEQLIRDEGFKVHPYRDTEGILTVGVGHNLEAHPLPEEQYPMTDERVKELARSDSDRIKAELAEKLPWTSRLDEARLGVLQNMSFNMGVHGLLQFKNMLAAVEQGNYAEAAAHMVDSKWAKQVGDRAERLKSQMTDGVWV